MENMELWDAFRAGFDIGRSDSCHYLKPIGLYENHVDAIKKLEPLYHKNQISKEVEE